MSDLKDLDVRIAAAINIPTPTDILILAIGQAVETALAQPDVIEKLADAVAAVLAQRPAEGQPLSASLNCLAAKRATHPRNCASASEDVLPLARAIDVAYGPFPAPTPLRVVAEGISQPFSGLYFETVTHGSRGGISFRAAGPFALSTIIPPEPESYCFKASGKITFSKLTIEPVQ